METAVLILNTLAALGVIGLVLMQHGKGADMGAAFGSGSAGSLFGSSGSANFLSRTTAILAAIFFVTSLGLTYFSSQQNVPKAGVMQTQKIDSQPSVPATPVPAPASSDVESKAKEIPK